MSKGRYKGKRTPTEQLADLLSECSIRAHVRENPHHDRPEFKAMYEIARVGWYEIAKELYENGVRPPEVETPSTLPKSRTRAKRDLPGQRLIPELEEAIRHENVDRR